MAMLSVVAESEEKQEDYEELDKVKQMDGEQPDCLCTGWSPDHGEWKGTGGSCDTFGWTLPWCYVNPDYQGSGYEFIKKSSIYDGKHYVPCKGAGTGKCEGVSNPSPATEDDEINDLMKGAEDAVADAGDDPQNAMVNLGKYPLSEVIKWNDANDCSFVQNDPAFLAVTMVIKLEEMKQKK